MAGALAGELWLIEWARPAWNRAGRRRAEPGRQAVALFLARRAGGTRRARVPAVDEPLRGARPLSPRSWPAACGRFLAGATLLALEVIWFRLLQLFVFGTSFIFAAMLAAILLGIGAGGVIASRWLGRDTTGASVRASGRSRGRSRGRVVVHLFDPRLAALAYTTGDTAAAVSLFFGSMLPTSLLSGVLFTLLGAAQRKNAARRLRRPASSFANTLAAWWGAAGGVRVVPHLGSRRRCSRRC